MKMAVSLFAITAFGLVGCQSAPLPPGDELFGDGQQRVVKLSPDEAAASDLGPAPTNYEELIKASMDLSLKDPYSAHYTFHDPVPGKVFHFHRPYNGIASGHYEYGWLCFFEVNAKNSFGGYTGEESEFWFFRGDTPIAEGLLDPKPSVGFIADDQK